MEDIFNQVVLCNTCKEETNRGYILKEGLKLRYLECPGCKKRIYHPSDLSEYDNFKRLRSKEFRVKLRMVGNSYTVSIPKEIIDFHEEMHREMEKEFDKIVRLFLERPKKLSLLFDEEKNG
jgi:DNA-directed RNA polymerase subunit RPC12/RpoP